METVGHNLVIAGTAKVGTLYGVYRFLEETLGVRWYTPEFTKTPKVKNLEIHGGENGPTGDPVSIRLVPTACPGSRFLLARVGFNYYYGGRDHMDRGAGSTSARAGSIGTSSM